MTRMLKPMLRRRKQKSHRSRILGRRGRRIRKPRRTSRPSMPRQPSMALLKPVQRAMQEERAPPRMLSRSARESLKMLHLLTRRKRFNLLLQLRPDPHLLKKIKPLRSNLARNRRSPRGLPLALLRDRPRTRLSLYQLSTPQR